MTKQESVFHVVRNSFMVLLGTLAVACITPAASAQTMNAPSTVTLQTYNDPWSAAKERWWDISNHANRQFNGFLDGYQSFNYSENPQVILTYDAAPDVPYFVGHIAATGLKPNFAYQLKLVGKPVKGSRGWRDAGDDVANERIGYAGRWWCDSSHATQTNFDDSHYETYYKNAPSDDEHDIYGYQFMGAFVTDEFGNANVAFNGQSSYHILWADWQGGTRHVEHPHSPFPIQGGLIDSDPPTYYGYGMEAPTTTVSLFYEYEGSGRPRDNVVLAAGTYSSRFVLTEESFHSTATFGGYWKTVMGSEDSFNTDTTNDIVFTIDSPTPPPTPTPPDAPSGLTATASSMNQIDLEWTDNSDNEDSFVIEQSHNQKAWTQIMVDADTTEYSATGLQVGKTFYFRVRALNNVGYSEYSNTASDTIPRTTSPEPDPEPTPEPTPEPDPEPTPEPTPEPDPEPTPATPTYLGATPISRSQIDLKWNDNSNNEDSFVIEHSINQKSWTQVTVSANATTYSATGLIGGKTYYFRMRAVNSEGYSEYSNTAIATTPKK